MKMTSKLLSIIIILSLFLGIGMTVITGYWQTESSKIPKRLANTDEYDPSDIRGSYSFDDVSKVFEIPLEDLKEAFQIPDTYSIETFKNKDLEGLYIFDDDKEVGNGSVKMFVSLYKDLPYDYESNNDYLPVSAYRLLEEKGIYLKDDKYIQSHLIDLSQVKQAVSLDEHEVEEIIKINRTVTFQQLIDIGLTQEQLEIIIEKEIETLDMSIKDYCDQNDLQFSLVKEKLQEMI